MTEATPPQEPAASEPSTRRGFLGRLDPGWATVIAAVIAITGTVLTLLFQAAGGSNPQLPPQTTPQSSQPSPSQSASDAAGATASGPATPTGEPTAQPTFTVVSTLAPNLRGQVISAGESLRSLSTALPLLVRDEFDNNDYLWALGTTDYADGVSCTTTMTSGHLHISVVSGRGPAYCYNGVERSVESFTLVTELGIPAQRNADVGVLFGAGDEERLVVINPQSQTLAVYQGASVLVAPTFVDDINPNGPNRIQLVVVESSLVVFIGDSLALLGSNVPPSEPGPARLYIKLNEGNQQITLQTDLMELRGH